MGATMRKITFVIVYKEKIGPYDQVSDVALGLLFKEAVF
jgi:hypothetical protein